MQENNPVTPANPIVQTEQPKKSSFLVVLLSILLFISLVIAGFFAYQTQKLVNELQIIRNEELVTPTSVPSTEPTTDPTVDPFIEESNDWKKYTNAKIGFTLSYPSNWMMLSDVDQSVNFGTKSSELNNFSVEYNIHSPYAVDSGLDQISQIEAHKNYYLNSTSFADGGGKELSKQEIKVDGKRAIRYTLQPLSKEKPDGSPVVWIYVLQNPDSVLKIALYGLDLTIHDQILSTFKFTN